MKHFKNLSIVLLAAWLSACAASTPLPSSTAQTETVEAAGVSAEAADVLQRSEHVQEIESLNEKLMSEATLHVDPGDYVLGAGDLINVDIFEAPELKTEARISSRGFITLPLVGQIKVADMTAREAEISIEKLYREKFIKDPHVSVFVEEHFSQRVTLMGQFKNPGTYDYPSKQRLLDALALGGGLTDKASRIIQIRRVGVTPAEDGVAREGVIYVDMDKLIREGVAELNIEINGGDVIFVPETGEFFVDGAVYRPGAYPVRRRTNLKEAIVAAGGMRPYAVQDEVYVIRNQDGKRQMIKVDISKLENWTMLVKDQDVILARSSFLGKIWYGFRFNLFGFGYEDPEDH